MRNEFHAKLLEKLVDVGDARFNQAHARLFEIIIDADVVVAAVLTEERTPTSAEWDTLAGYCDDLVTYAKQHFIEEEEELLKRGYPAAEAHQASHHALIADLNAFKHKVLQFEEKDLKEMRRWLLEWLLNHVNHEDHAYARFFAGLGTP
ncbi:MAG: hemerythrin family protein [Magnetococcales bacterium]|nr:hemerythrin family protein [Magnetococcales bacterium]